MAKTTPKQLGKRFNSVYMDPVSIKHLDLLNHRATTSVGKPVSILRVIAEKKNAFPSFLVVCLVLDMFRLLHDFRTNSP